MTSTATNNWQDVNQHYLMAALASVREALEAKAKEQEIKRHSPPPSFPAHVSPLPALEQLCTIFGLSSFERDVLLLCAGMELDATFPLLCATAQGDSQRTYPTFSLALATLKPSQWNALMPTAPLRQWRLIEVGTGSALTLSPLKIDERILHYLIGLQYLDERLTGIVEPSTRAGELVTSHRQVAEQLAAIWSQASGKFSFPIVQLCGNNMASKRAIAVAACERVGLRLNTIQATAIPLSISDRHQLMRLWAREYALRPTALLVDCDEVDLTDTARENAIQELIEGISSPLIITSYERRRSRQRPLITFDVTQPTTSEQRILWLNTLGPATANLNGQIETLVSNFNLSAPTIQAICTEALGKLAAEELKVERWQMESSNLQPLPFGNTDGEQPPNLSTLLWDTCRSQSRPNLNDLAQHIETSATWDDLVLPERERQVLVDIAAHVRQRSKVYENWGFAGKSGRGLGISALFAGPSGTGKTMAAEVLARTLQLDLYRIDLSSVVSKYIGETEKNLRRVFDAAEAGGAILLFDEADAIFGKRSEVKDSHDRYANMEVSYLLQRMEAYRGLAILTTNLKDAMDTAFLRRIRFVVKFPFPDANQRAEIWRRIFPKNTPTEELDFGKLSRLNVTGGNIRNIALNAAFLAADAEESVGMKHLLRSAQSEYAKLERPLTDAEARGWV
ncbi:MAG: ATP-binding protein [Cyanobacteriota bacterium]